MAKHPPNGIPAKLSRAETLITNSLSDTTIQSYVGKYGYTADRLNEGKALLDAATGVKDTHVAASGAKKVATAAEGGLRKAAEDAYQSYSTIAKGVFQKDKESLAKLGLDKPMPRTEAGFIAAGKTLFDNASSDEKIKAAMANDGYDDAKLADEKAKILAYEAAVDAQAAANGASQDSTQEQTKAVKALADWVSGYMRVARVALKEKPQLLEKLGILVRNTRTKPQKQAPQKAAATRAAKKNASQKQ